MSDSSVDGTFVKRDGGIYASLQEGFDSPDMKEITRALEGALANSGKLKTAPKKPIPHDDPNKYFPAGKLHDDGVLVVRTSALTEFQSRMEDATGQPRESTRERNNLMRIIGLMANHRYPGDVGKPYSIAGRLVEKAKDLGISIGDEATAKHIKAAIAQIEREKTKRKS